MKGTAEQYGQCIRLLQGQPVFIAGYTHPNFATYGKRRTRIGDYLWHYRGVHLKDFTHFDVEDRDQLRRYFDRELKHPQVEANKYAHIDTVEPVFEDRSQEHEVSLFEEVVLCLENDRTFYEAYTSCDNSAKTRRRCIDEAICRQRTLPHEAGHIDQEDREILRRYFDNNWDMAPVIFGAMGHSYTARFPMKVLMQFPPWNSQKKTPIEAQTMQVVVECKQVAEDVHRWTEEQLSQLAAQSAQPLEFNMIKITTQTLLNGKNIADMTDEQLYDAISAAEAEIKKCEAIQHKPNKLVAKIAELNDGIAALVAHMDAQK